MAGLGGLGYTVVTMAKRSKKTKTAGVNDTGSGEANGAGSGGLTYAGAGVDIDAGDAMVGMIKSHMRRTYGPRVLGRHGAFAGLFRLDYNEKIFARNYREPVLVACTDGVGSKVKLAIEMGICDTVGQDVVAMNVNDMIVQGAEPLLFLDYIGTHKLEPAKMTDIVKGVSDGCVLSGCALLGGETAELPDLYAKDDFDLAGFAVGVCELSRVIDGNRVEPGDVVLGLGSSGVHSNGYTLVRAIVKKAKLKLNAVYPELDATRTLGEVLLEPTRIYVKSIVSLLRGYRVKQPVSAMAHITGGGLPGNLPRVLHDEVDVKLARPHGTHGRGKGKSKSKGWDIPPVFKFLQKHGGVADDEMMRVFNMGIGYVVVVRPHFAEAVAKRLAQSGESVFELGTIVKGKGRLVWG